MKKYEYRFTIMWRFDRSDQTGCGKQVVIATTDDEAFLFAIKVHRVWVNAMSCGVVNPVFSITLNLRLEYQATSEQERIEARQKIDLEHYDTLEYYRQRGDKL